MKIKAIAIGSGEIHIVSCDWVGNYPTSNMDL
jgi:hypothetical protein